MPESQTAAPPNRILTHIQSKVPRGWSLRPGQVEALNEYWAHMASSANIAVHLPTGYGKTLVGLAVADFRRAEMGERVVWLCPTRQLVHQVVTRAKQVGVSAYGFVGPLGSTEDLNAYARWHRRMTTAVTVYPRIFARDVDTIHPHAAATIKFDDAAFAVLDDVHASEQAVSEHWTLTLERSLQFRDRKSQEPVGVRFSNPAYHRLLAVVAKFLPPRISKYELRSDVYKGTEPPPYDGGPVYCLPFPVLADRVEVIKGAISHWLRWKNLRGLKEDFDGYTGDYYDPLFFERQVWDNIKDNLYTMQVLLSRERIVLRPYICPVGIHPSWQKIGHRLFMSATMRVDGEIQKLFGTADVRHLQQTVDVVQATGRRLIVSCNPEARLADGTGQLDAIIRGASRLIIITPGKRAWDELVQKAPSLATKKVLDAEETEEHLDDFLGAADSILQYYGRYEGVDVPNERCRAVLLYGIPYGLTPMETFLNFEIGCEGLVTPRIAARLEQGLGRCNRKPDDFSLIMLDSSIYVWILRSEDLVSAFVTKERDFGINIVGEFKDVAALVRKFLRNRTVRSQIAARFDTEIAGASRQASIGMARPEKDTWEDEILFSRSMWNRQYEEAYAAAFRIASAWKKRAEAATGKEAPAWAKSAWWLYLAGISKACSDRKRAALFEYTAATTLWGDARACIERSGAGEQGLAWWDELLASMRVPRFVDEVLKTALPVDGSLDSDCLVRQCKAFQALVASHEFTAKSSQIRDWLLEHRDHKKFEKALELLGKYLGFNTKPSVATGADCVWWNASGSRRSDHVYVIFEAKSTEQGAPSDLVDKNSLNQLDGWKVQEMSAFNLKGEETIVLVRVGRQMAIWSEALSGEERIERSTLAAGKAIVSVEDLSSFAERLLCAFEDTYSICMKQHDFQGDESKLRRLLYFCGKKEKSLPSEWLRWLRGKIHAER